MKILVIEDEPALLYALTLALRHAGFEVLSARNEPAMNISWQTNQADLIVLDLNLPKLDGFELCRHIRTSSMIPIIMLSTCNSDDMVVKGFGVGADDYVVKPFSIRELVARVHAILRRVDSNTSYGLLVVGNLMLDRTRNLLRYQEGGFIHLTHLEARLLEMLMCHAGEVVSSEQLIHAIWDNEAGNRMPLRQIIYRLRLKMEANKDHLPLIECVPGIGYTLVSVPAQFS
ncbi:MAG: response regulator transcription factor [Caldilineaceae bacterium]